MPLGDVQDRVAELVAAESGDQETGRGHMPFTPRAKTALELADRDSADAGDTGIERRHLLLGLLNQGDSRAVEALVGLEVDVEQLSRHARTAADPPAVPTIARVATELDQLRGVVDGLAGRLSALEERLPPS